MVEKKKTMRKPYIYLILAITAGLAVWFLEKPAAEKTGDVLNKPFFQNLDISKITAIEIEHLLNGVKLKLEKGAWWVAPLKTKFQENLEKAEDRRQKTENGEQKWEKVPEGKVDTVLDILLDTRIVSMAGSNPEFHGYFEVNPVGEHIRFYDAAGKLIEHFFIGKAGGVFMEGYLRKEGQNEVYLANKFLRAYFPATVEGWLPSPQPSPTRGEGE